MKIALLNRTLEWPGRSWFWYQAGDPGPNTYAEFFADFDLAARPRAAWIGLSADASYKLWLDGQWLFMGPMREVPPFFYYDVLDLAPLLEPGKHRLRLLVHRPGVVYSTHVPAEGGLLVQGEIDDGKNQLDLGETKFWKVRRAPGYQPDGHRLGGCLGFSEHFDFSRADPDWLTGPIPADAIEPVPTATFPHGKLLQPLRRDLPAFVGDTYHARAFETLPDAQLFDFGREVFGFVTLRFRLSVADTFSLAYGENLVQGRPNPAKQGMNYRDQLSAPAGEYCWTSYEKRAGRYVELPRHVEVLELAIEEYHYPYQRAYVPPRGEDPASWLDRSILDVSARSIELCSDDLLNDCPLRERSQYLDPWTYFAALPKLFGTVEPIRKYLRQMLRPIAVRGRFPMCYPSPPQAGSIPDFAFTVPLAIARYFDLSGDLELVRQSYEPAVAAVKEYEKYEDDGHLLQNVPGWVFLDNTFELNKFPRSAGLNAIYAAAYAALARLAERTDRPAEAETFQRHHDAVRAAWRKVFLRPETILDADSSPIFATRHFWNYHFSADTGRWQGRSFLLKTQLRFETPGGKQLHVSHFNGCRVWLDGEEVMHEKSGGGWTRPPIFHPTTIPVNASGKWQDLWIEVEFSPADWEFYLGTDEPLETGPTQVCELEEFGRLSAGQSAGLICSATSLHRYAVPHISQISVGFAAAYGMLEATEALRLLKACLPADYVSTYARRTTPFFVTVAEDLEGLRRGVMPCNTPNSLFVFCEALRKYGLAEEAREYIRRIYGGMLQRGATSWWEEWGTASSLCHAWGAFVADHLL